MFLRHAGPMQMVNTPTCDCLYISKYCAFPLSGLLHAIIFMLLLPLEHIIVLQPLLESVVIVPPLQFDGMRLTLL